jgi:hypothetical protein
LGENSQYNVGYILAEHPKKGISISSFFTIPSLLLSRLSKSPPLVQDANTFSQDSSRSRPYETIRPLAHDLGLSPNIIIDRDDASDVAAAAKAYRGPGNVLICWEHGQLSLIAKALGVIKEVKYPDDRFDLIWMVMEPYTEISSITSEQVPGLDDGLETP